MATCGPSPAHHLRGRVARPGLSLLLDIFLRNCLRFLRVGSTGSSRTSWGLQKCSFSVTHRDGEQNCTPHLGPGRPCLRSPVTTLGRSISYIWDPYCARAKLQPRCICLYYQCGILSARQRWLVSLFRSSLPFCPAQTRVPRRSRAHP